MGAAGVRALESRYRYSASLVYNNFPWPESMTETQSKGVQTAAQRVLDVREEHLNKGSTLADLYDPLATPPALTKAHAALTAVDRCYRSQPFISDRQRVEFLFALYEKITAPLLPEKGRKKRAGYRRRQGNTARGSRLAAGPANRIAVI